MARNEQRVMLRKSVEKEQQYDCLIIGATAELQQCEQFLSTYNWLEQYHLVYLFPRNEAKRKQAGERIGRLQFLKKVLSERVQ